MKKFLAIIFILLGIGLFAYTPFREMYDEYEKNKLIEMYDNNFSNFDEDSNLYDYESEEESISDFYKYFYSLEESLSESTEISDKADEEKDTNELKDVIGIIKIDKIDIKLPIKSYFNEKEFKSYAGHLPGTAKPGELGNCVIAGHRARARGRLFNRLDELEIGDKILITYNSNNFEYKVIEIKIVEPTDTSVLKVAEDESILTLITCHPIKTNTHRLIIKASLLQ
jgi:sortase A